MALRRNINAGLADSLLEVFRACSGHVEIREAEADRIVDRLSAGSRETPYLYSLYFSILAAIERDDIAGVQSLIDRLLATESAQAGLLITSLIPEQFPWDAAMVSGYFSAEADSVFRYVVPPSGLVPERSAQIREALDMLSLHAPRLMGEMEEIVTTIILAQGVDEAHPEEAGTFQGSSALRAFGGIIVDIEPSPSLIDAVALLVHEAAHNVLFALAPKDGVVRNGLEERYSSPLRDDLRPLEGIFHAVFVVARMAFAMRELIGSGQLTPEQAERAAEILEDCARMFADGDQTLARHAELTEEGRIAMDCARAFMAGVPA